MAYKVGSFLFKASGRARVSHLHPTYAEGMKEACLAATKNRAIHM